MMTDQPDPAAGEKDYTEQLGRAEQYICHERHLFHRYCVLQDSPAFPLFFMDRCYDWQFEATGDVPLVSRYNGFMELVCTESWRESAIPVDDLLTEIRRAISAGSQVAVPISTVHTDGTPYVTEWLIEAADDDTVYYTKTSPDRFFRAFRKPVPFAELIGYLPVTGDGRVLTTEIHASPTIERILNLGSLEAFRAV